MDGSDTRARIGGVRQPGRAAVRNLDAIMTIAIVVGLLLVAVGTVASQLFRLKDWLDKAPPPSAPPTEHPDDSDDS